MKYDSIKVLEGMEAIRINPQMFVGSVETPVHLFYEVFDNALDEIEAGGAKEVKCTFYNHQRSEFSVYDTGRGFPVKDEDGNDAVETAFTKLFSGAKFKGTKESYGTSRGLHGVGLSAVNALSTEINVITIRGRTLRTRTFVDGKLIQFNKKRVKEDDPSGTSVLVVPDPKYFESVLLTRKMVLPRIQMAATLNPGVEFTLQYQDDDRPGHNKEIVKGFTPTELLPGKIDIGPIELRATDSRGQSMWVVVGYDTKENVDLKSGSVNLALAEEGTHIQRAALAIVNAWQEWIEGRDIKKWDVEKGMRLFVSCNILNPQYTSQTKEKLRIDQKEFKDLEGQIQEQFSDWLKKHARLRKALIKKFEDYRKTMNRLNESTYLGDVIEFGRDDEDQSRTGRGDSKLLDCSRTGVDGTELFVVEGDSAYGSLLQVRDPETTAILPLRGKSMNVIDRPIRTILDNLEIRSLINGIGAGAFQAQKVDSIRYEKIILFTDADPDGQHILALLIGALCYVVPDVVKRGSVYWLESPLYGRYDKEKFVPVWKKSDKFTSRFKGLGELNPEQIRGVALGSKRRLHQLTTSVQGIKKVLEVVGTKAGKKSILEEFGLLSV